MKQKNRHQVKHVRRKPAAKLYDGNRAKRGKSKVTAGADTETVRRLSNSLEGKKQNENEVRLPPLSIINRLDQSPLSNLQQRDRSKTYPATQTEKAIHNQETTPQRLALLTKWFKKRKKVHLSDV
jgi:hypothetical protein